MKWFGSRECSEMNKDLGRRCCDLLAIKGSLSYLMANHELVDILEGITAWDLLHPTAALSMIPTASPRTSAGDRRTAGWLQGTRQPTPWETPPSLTWPVSLLQHHCRGTERLGAGRARTWILADEGRG